MENFENSSNLVNEIKDLIAHLRLSANELSRSQLSENLENLEDLFTQLIENKSNQDVDTSTWICSECTLKNTNDSEFCMACGNPQSGPNLYHQLLVFEEAGIVPNLEEFECPICYVEFEAYQGVTLKNCFHKICKVCLEKHIELSDDATIKCPNSCDSVIQNREIRATVSDEVFKKYLERSLRLAKTKDSVHCITPNCTYFVYADEGPSNFLCPLCNHVNCLVCKAIHDNMTCTQYKEEKSLKETDPLVTTMIDGAEAMICPNCQAIVSKTAGCDWLKCPMCQSEICWATKKLRRGPNGCHCKENDILCHPNCQNCH